MSDPTPPALPARLRGPQRPLVVPSERSEPEPPSPGAGLAVVEPEVVEGELLDPVDPHGVKAIDKGAVVELVCRCGQWEAAAGGPSSLRWARDAHRRHVTEATTADGDA